MRVALLTNILTPYRVPVYEILAATPGWELRVMVNAESEFDRSWQVERGSLDVERVTGFALRRRIRARGRALYHQITTLHIPTGLPAALRRFAPDVVISAELGARTLIALLYARLTGTPLVIWSYHSRVGATGAGPLQRLWRRFLLANAQAVVGMGRQARDVLSGLGVPSERIFDAPNACDHDSVVRAVEGCEPEALRASLQERLGCRERIALVVGRLVPMKGVAPLIQAWEWLPEELRARWTLLFVGSGPLEALLREAEASADRGEIAHTPTVPPDEVAGYYAASDLLVFSSLGDPWGLVVNEALASGLPVLCSRLAGCADDLVRPGENGWHFDPHDPQEFARTLREAMESEDREALRDAARDTAGRFRPERMADGIRRAVQHAAAPPERASALETA